MNDQLILFGVGLLVFVLGLIFLRREKKLFEDSVVTSAKVVDYYIYRSEHNSTMYTMEVEYRIQDGTLVHTREQGGSSRKKYEVGTELEVYYSTKKPELFIICGDHSKKIVLYGMVIVGLIIMIAFGYLLITGGIGAK